MSINYAKIFCDNNRVWFANNINSTPLDDYYEAMRIFPVFCGENITKRFYTENIWRQATYNPYILDLCGRQGSGKSSTGISFQDYNQYIQIRRFLLEHSFDKELEMVRHALYEPNPVISSFHCDEVKKKSLVGFDMAGQYSWLEDSYTRMRAREYWISKCSITLEDDIISPYTLLPFQSIRNPLKFEQQIVISCKVYTRHPQNFRQTLIGFVNIPLSLDLVSLYFKTTKKKLISTPHLLEVQSTYPKEWEDVIAQLLNNKEFLEIPLKFRYVRMMYIQKHFQKVLKQQSAAKGVEELSRYSQLCPDSTIFKKNADRADKIEPTKKEIIENFEKNEEIKKEQIKIQSQKHLIPKGHQIINKLTTIQTKEIIESKDHKDIMSEQQAQELVNKSKNPEIIKALDEKIKAFIKIL